MDDLSREFMTTASKMEIQRCDDIEELKKVTVQLVDLVQKQKGFIAMLMLEQMPDSLRGS